MLTFRKMFLVLIFSALVVTFACSSVQHSQKGIGTKYVMKKMFESTTPFLGTKFRVFASSSNDNYTYEQFSSALAKRRLIIVGEQHNKVRHHIVELEVIKMVHKQHPNIAIGMEMFFKPFQNVLDDYILYDKISEEEFLKKTEYYKRWRFPFYLYKPIIDYAKRNKIRILALNAPKELTEKISQVGLDGLTPEERAQLPEEMDFSNTKHRKFSYQAYKLHQTNTPFQHHYEVFVAWEETMAETAAKFLNDHPDYKIVILAGAGHVLQGFGIPDRTKRRTNEEYISIIPIDADQLKLDEIKNRITPNIATFLVITPPTPFLGIGYEENNDGGILVNFVQPKSPADKAGLQQGDIILAIDDIDINDKDTLPLLLNQYDLNDKIKIKVKRDSEIKILQASLDVPRRQF